MILCKNKVENALYGFSLLKAFNNFFFYVADADQGGKFSLPAAPCSLEGLEISMIDRFKGTVAPAWVLLKAVWCDRK